MLESECSSGQRSSMSTFFPLSPHAMNERDVLAISTSPLEKTVQCNAGTSVNRQCGQRNSTSTCQQFCVKEIWSEICER